MKYLLEHSSLHPELLSFFQEKVTGHTHWIVHRNNVSDQLIKNRNSILYEIRTRWENNALFNFFQKCDQAALILSEKCKNFANRVKISN